MNYRYCRNVFPKLLLTALASAPMLVHAQYFVNPTVSGDLLAGFRKTGAHQGTNEVVVYLGNVTNLIAMPMGTTTTLKNVSMGPLTAAFGSDLTFVQWSVFTANFSVDFSWNSPLGAFPRSTIWYSLPRTNSAVPTVPKARAAASAQANAATSMQSIDNGANTIGAALPGGTNANNNTFVVVEPVQSAYAQFNLTSRMGDRFNPPIGDLGGDGINFNIEQTAPAPFNSASVADLYESAPAPGGRPLTYYTDPISGNTTNVYYVGHFNFNPSGTLTFTREAVATTAPPPPPPVLGVAFNATTATISFGTTNGASYTVIYTNYAGLTAPRSTWPVLGSPISGNGGTATVQDSLTAEGRVYSIIAH